MRIRFGISLVTMAAVLGLMALPAFAQPVPRLPNGKPDLSGVWDPISSKERGSNVPVTTIVS